MAEDAHAPPLEELVAIDQLVIDPEKYQIRVAFREDVAEGDYAENYLSLPEPKVALLPDGRKVLFDGVHTVHAYRVRERSKIRVRVFPVETEDDVLLLALGANATHGIARTPEDKRKAVRRALEHETFGKWTNRKIADACAVSEGLVRLVKDECEREVLARERNANQPAKKKKEPQKRVGRDGRLYTPGRKKRKPKQGRVRFEAKKAKGAFDRLLRSLDDLYRAYGKVGEKGGVSRDEEYGEMNDLLKAFWAAWVKRCAALSKEKPPEE